MPEFTVIEVQTVTRLRKWRWTVQAASMAEAIEKARNGESDEVELVQDGGQNIGEEDYGRNGFGKNADAAIEDMDQLEPRAGGAA